MLKPLLIVGFFLSTESIRFYDLIPEGETTFHGIPVEKYVESMNRLIQITHKLQDLDTNKLPKFEEIDWISNATQADANPFLYQGDIVFHESMLDALVEDFEIQLVEKEGQEVPSRLYSVGIYHWTKFPISWQIDNARPPDGGINAVRNGIALWEANTCITFRESNDYANGGLVFYSGRGCSSPLGKQNLNYVSLGPGCRGQATVAHEIGHSLGLFHTQTRPDATDYVDIFWQNIQPAMAYNYKPPQAFYQATTRGLPYDLGSMMHYGHSGFPIQYGLETMRPKDQFHQETMGQRSELAFSDAKEINMMYCDICPEKLPCYFGGYTDPKNCSICRCPEGLGGRLCDTVAPSDPKCGRGLIYAYEDYRTLNLTDALDCNFMIYSPANKKVALILDRADFGGSNFEGACDYNYIELKYDIQNYQVTGARFCPYNRPPPVVISASMTANRVYVLFRSKNSRYGFSLRYRHEPRDDPTVLPPTSPPATPEPTTKAPESTPEPVESQWGPWSACQYTCGGCGIQQRVDINDHSRKQRRYCSFNPCYAPDYPGPYCCGIFYYDENYKTCVAKQDS
ncbi:hypothetical protein L596_016077 [Steinernema carpocapsae]|uniref:Zinc metalloproteinase n=1 Tax=Steinernema carpocapsae TaxID=34508 RepID=A0A4U5NGX7_STECR|nr:hypothetical protein L596_016077 [Steinernema carpocapsae]